MAGLLDIFDSPDARMSLGLLAAAGPSPTPQSFGQRLYGLLNQVQSQKAAEEDRKMKQMLLQSQIDETRAQAEQRSAAARKAQADAARAAEFRNALLGTTPQQALAAGGGPTQANAASIGGLDWGALARQFPEQVDLVKKLAESGDFGRPEVARTVDTMDPRGAPVSRNIDRFGRQIGSDLPQWKAPVQVDTGGAVGMMNPVTMDLLRQFQKSNSPDALLSAQTAMRGQNMTDARSREANAAGRVPPGYRFKPDGTLEAIPGGPADIKAGEAGAKAEKAREQAIAGASNVMDTIAQAKQLVGVTTSGIGGLAAPIPATSARDLRAKLDTIKANIGFDRLQQMREASPTGGALGQVAVQELMYLQATIANLDQLQSPSDLRAALNKVEQHYGNWLKTLGPRTGGATGSWGDEAPVRRFNPATGRIE